MARPLARQIPEHLLDDGLAQVFVLSLVVRVTEVLISSLQTQLFVCLFELGVVALLLLLVLLLFTLFLLCWAIRLGLLFLSLALRCVAPAASVSALLAQPELEDLHDVDGFEAVGLGQVHGESALARADRACYPNYHIGSVPNKLF